MLLQIQERLQGPESRERTGSALHGWEWEAVSAEVRPEMATWLGGTGGGEVEQRVAGVRLGARRWKPEFNQMQWEANGWSARGLQLHFEKMFCFLSAYILILDHGSVFLFKGIKF